MFGEVSVTLLAADGEGEEGGEVIHGFGAGLGVRRAEFDRGDADGGHDLGGFLGGVDLAGFERGDHGLEAFDFLGGHFEGGGQFGELVVLLGGGNLKGFQLGGGAHGEFLDGGTEVVALGGDARDSGGGFEELFFDGHLDIAKVGIRTNAGRR